MTTLSGCSGGITALLWTYLMEKHASLESAMTGVLAAMVGICSSCGCTTIWAAFWVIAPVAVLAYRFGLWFHLKLKVDDPLGASALHYWPGIWSMIACGIFSEPDIWEMTYGFGYGAKRRATQRDGEDDYAGIVYGGNGALGAPAEPRRRSAPLLPSPVFEDRHAARLSASRCGRDDSVWPRRERGSILRHEAVRHLDATHHGGPAYLDVDEAVVIKHEGSLFKRKKADTATAEA